MLQGEIEEVEEDMVEDPVHLPCKGGSTEAPTVSGSSHCCGGSRVITAMLIYSPAAVRRFTEDD